MNHNCIQKIEEEVAFHRDELVAQALYQVYISLTKFSQQLTLYYEQSKLIVIFQLIIIY